MSDYKPKLNDRVKFELIPTNPTMASTIKSPATATGVVTKIFTSGGFLVSPDVNIAPGFKLENIRPIEGDKK